MSANDTKNADLSILVIVSIDEDACFQSEDGNRESLPRHTPDQTITVTD